MFDNLLILDTGGFPIYYGNPVESVIYFKKAINHVTANESECHHCGNVNPEQIFNIIETKVVDEYGNITEQRRIPPKTWNEVYQQEIDNQEIKDVLTVNGVRFSFEDGSWGLIRASSNKPSLVIVTESPTSNERKKKIFEFIDNLLKKTGRIGEYDQKI